MTKLLFTDSILFKRVNDIAYRFPILIFSIISIAKSFCDKEITSNSFTPMFLINLGRYLGPLVQQKKRQTLQNFLPTETFMVLC